MSTHSYLPKIYLCLPPLTYKEFSPIPTHPKYTSTDSQSLIKMPTHPNLAKIHLHKPPLTLTHP